MWEARYKPQPEVSNGVAVLECRGVRDGLDGGPVDRGAGFAEGARLWVGALGSGLGADVLAAAGLLATTVATAARGLFPCTLALTRTTCCSSTAGAARSLAGTAALADPS